MAHERGRSATGKAIRLARVVRNPTYIPINTNNLTKVTSRYSPDVRAIIALGLVIGIINSIYVKFTRITKYRAFQHYAYLFNCNTSLRDKQGYKMTQIISCNKDIL